MNDFSSTTYARDQRMRKATALADELWTGEQWQGAAFWPVRDRDDEPIGTYRPPTRLPGPPPQADPAMRERRRLVEKAAGVRPCSEETWWLVRDLLEQRRVDAEAQRQRDLEIRW